MKKILALAAAVSMLAVSLIGCGSKAPETKAPETEAPKTEAAAPETEAAADDGELVLTSDEMTIELWDIATEDPKKTVEESPVIAFSKDYPNIHINQTHIVNDTYKQKLLIAMSSGQCPDAYIHWTGGPMNEYYKSGFCDDIGDLFEKYNKTPYLGSALAMCTADDGTLIGLPYGGISAVMIFYNKELFEKAGCTVPSTMDELEEVCEKLKAADITPFALANGSKWTGSLLYMYAAARYGGPEAVAKAYSGEGSFADEPFIHAAETIQKWVAAGYFNEGVNSMTSDAGQDRQMMYQEDAAMTVQLSGVTGNFRNDNAEWYEAKIDSFPWPVDTESEKAGIDQTIAVGTAVGQAYSFNSKGDEEKLKAMFKLVNTYYSSDEYNQLLLTGTGKVASVEGMEQYITDPNLMNAWDIFSNASNVQLFWDQYLPAPVAEVHKDTMSGLFDLSMTPEEICNELQAAFEKYLAEK